jgi:hypothetical protein
MMYLNSASSGHRVDRTWVIPKGEEVRIIDGLWTSESFHRFLFSDLNVTGMLNLVTSYVPSSFSYQTDDDAGSNESKVGLIKVEIEWRRQSSGSSSTGPAFNNQELRIARPVHETTKEMTAHRVTLGQNRTWQDFPPAVTRIESGSSKKSQQLGNL